MYTPSRWEGARNVDLDKVQELILATLELLEK